MMTRSANNFRQSDVTRAVRGALKAGMTVRGVEIANDGKISIFAGSPSEADSSDLDRELAEFRGRHRDKD
jgi:hypothetical protein